MNPINFFIVDPLSYLFRSTVSMVVFLFLFLHTLPSPGYADIVTDGTVGPAKALTGPDFTIPQNLGTLSGQNLYHSFQTFGISQNQSATFTGSDAISNVISRVTGDEASVIDGLLRSEVGQADFFFINPNGVLFGPHAEINVPAAFHVSTANELTFDDGTRFSAVSPERSTLTQAAPEAFGFLGPQAATIEVNGSVLEFAPESRVTFSSGDITIQGAQPNSNDVEGNPTDSPLSGNRASMTCEQGEIQLTAMGETSATLSLDGATSADAAGSLLLNAADVTVNGNGGGRISIQAGNARISGNSVVASDNTGDIDAKEDRGVHIQTNGTFEIMEGSRIQSNVSGGGDSGTITIDAQNMLIKQQDNEALTGVFMEVEPEATGNGTAMNVTVKEQLTIQGAASLPNTTYGYGNASSVNVKAGDLVLDGEGRSVAYKNSESWIAGISSQAAEGSHGDTGTVSVSVDNLLTMQGGCGINSSTSGSGNAENVIVEAKQINVDGLDSNGNFTGIASGTASEGDAGIITISADHINIDGKGYHAGILTNANPDSEGNAGTLKINVGGLLQLINGAEISSSTWAKGDAGNITISADHINIDGEGYYAGIFTNANPDSEGNAGIVGNALEGSIGNAGIIHIIINDDLQLNNGGQIRSDTFSKGNAGNISIHAGNISIDDQGNKETLTGITSSVNSESEGNAGSLIIIVEGLIQLTNGAEIASATLSIGDGGDISVSADQMIIDGKGNNTGIVGNALEGSIGNAGTIHIIINDDLQLNNGGQIRSDTFSKGNAGNISIHAGNISIDGQGNKETLTGIFTNANPDSEGNAGTLKINVGSLLQLINGAEISSSTWAKGDAGNITISADHINIDGEGYYAGIFTNANPDSEGNAGIVGNALEGSIGNAGIIHIIINDDLQLNNGGQIRSDTFSKGNAGNISIHAGNISIDDQGNKEALTGISSSVNFESEGNAGSLIIIVEGLIQLTNGAEIASATLSIGDGGDISVSADQMIIDGKGNNTGILGSALEGSIGNAGTIHIIINDDLQLNNGGQIRSDTSSIGNAGNISIHAGNISIDDQGNKEALTGISSNAYSGSEGNAGTLKINVGSLLQLINGAEISSSTWAKGDAGNVYIDSSDILVDSSGIGCVSTSDSSGDVGNIEINADSTTLLNGSMISNSSIQTLLGEGKNESSESTIEVNSTSLYLDQQSHITSLSSGIASASDIVIQSEKLTLKNDSSINTFALIADGGDIDIQANNIILHDGIISTSVKDIGNGGDINIMGMTDGESAEHLIMKHGFIQANTNAKQNASGGDIDLHIKKIITDTTCAPLSIGHPYPIGFSAHPQLNVIQAAAPDGIKGDINTYDALLDLDITGVIAGIDAQLSPPVRLALDPCVAEMNRQDPSTLIHEGSGGVPEWPGDASTIQYNKRRLEQLFHPIE